jgi:hypothetical protein
VLAEIARHARAEAAIRKPTRAVVSNIFPRCRNNRREGYLSTYRHRHADPMEWL